MAGHSHGAVRLFALLITASLAACGDGQGEAAGPAGEPLPFETGAEMLPGDNCRSCHGSPSTRYPDAPAWSMAGTIFAGPDSDEGVEGVSVVAVDASGAKVTAVSNRVGNFYTALPLVAPYSVSLSKGSRSVTMAVPPPAGGCNACHALRPVGGAPGRLYLPDGPLDSAAQCDEVQTVSVGDTDYDCAPYRCRTEPDECLRSCVNSDDCVEGARCETGRCVGP